METGFGVSLIRAASARVTVRLLTLGALALAASANMAVAQTARSSGSGGGQTQQLMQQMQQLASERTALQAENAKMKKELAELTKERDSLKTARSAVDQRVEASQAAVARSARDKEALESENGKLKERMQELVGKFRETANTLRDVEGERAAFKQSLDQKNVELTACVAKNDSLFKLNDEVLTRFEQQGMFSRLASAEPFTKLKRVELQNLIDDYRYRADEQKVVPSASNP